MKVIGIYDTNSFEGGLRLKTSRFNHSCWPNAYVGIENEIRATYNIKVGQEITINYRLHIKIFFRKNQRNVKYVCLKYDLGEYLCTQKFRINLLFPSLLTYIDSYIDYLLIKNKYIDCIEKKCLRIKYC